MVFLGYLGCPHFKIQSMPGRRSPGLETLGDDDVLVPREEPKRQPSPHFSAPWVKLLVKSPYIYGIYQSTLYDYNQNYTLNVYTAYIYIYIYICIYICMYIYIYKIWYDSVQLIGTWNFSLFVEWPLNGRWALWLNFSDFMAVLCENSCSWGPLPVIAGCKWL